MTTYVYRQSEPDLWTVGFFDPDGVWNPDSDHDSPAAAADRLHWLNGGTPAPRFRQTTRPRLSDAEVEEVRCSTHLAEPLLRELIYLRGRVDKLRGIVWEASKGWAEHPEGYDEVCACAECRSYGD